MSQQKTYLVIPCCIAALCFAVISVTLSTGCTPDQTTQPDQFTQPTAEEPNIGTRSVGGID